MIELKQIDSTTERMIVTGMIVSDRFLRDIQTIFKLDYLETPFAKAVVGWCLSYWRKYKKAPGMHIQDIFNHHSRNGLNPDMTELIRLFLASISTEYEKAEHFNVDYLLSQAETRFKERSLKILSEDIEGYLVKGNIKEAELCLKDYRRVERPQTAGINPFTDRSAIYQAIAKREENILFSLPGELGRFIGPIERSTLTGILSSEKKGKSFMLMQVGITAIEERCNVAFFEVGDMIQEDVIRRVSIHTTMSSDKKAGQKVKIPVVDCLHNQTNDCMKEERMCKFGVLRRKPGTDADVFIKASFEEAQDYIPCDRCRGTKEFKGAVWYRNETTPKLSWRKAWEAGKSKMSRVGGKDFKLFTFSLGQINVDGIRNVLDYAEEREGFVPDVIIVDYADILAPMDSRMDERGRQNEIWKSLRALSQERYCAVFTATQANADSYTKKSLTESNYSEDKRKYAHVNGGFWTLNQTAEEKKNGIMRIGRMFVREDEYETLKHCTVLQCLNLGRPYLDSFM